MTREPGQSSRELVASFDSADTRCLYCGLELPRSELRRLAAWLIEEKATCDYGYRCRDDSACLARRLVDVDVEEQLSRGA